MIPKRVQPDATANTATLCNFRDGLDDAGLCSEADLGIPRKLATWAGWIVLLTGGQVLLGWLFDISWLKSILPGFVAMKANTAC